MGINFDKLRSLYMDGQPVRKLTTPFDGDEAVLFEYTDDPVKKTLTVVVSPNEHCTLTAPETISEGDMPVKIGYSVESGYKFKDYDYIYAVLTASNGRTLSSSQYDESFLSPTEISGESNFLLHLPQQAFLEYDTLTLVTVTEVEPLYEMFVEVEPCSGVIVDPYAPVFTSRESALKITFRPADPDTTYIVSAKIVSEDGTSVDRGVNYRLLSDGTIQASPVYLIVKNEQGKRIVFHIEEAEPKVSDFIKPLSILVTGETAKIDGTVEFFDADTDEPVSEVTVGKRYYATVPFKDGLQNKRISTRYSYYTNASGSSARLVDLGLIYEDTEHPDHFYFELPISEPDFIAKFDYTDETGSVVEKYKYETLFEYYFYIIAEVVPVVPDRRTASCVVNATNCSVTKLYSDDLYLYPNSEENTFLVSVGDYHMFPGMSGTSDDNWNLANINVTVKTYDDEGNFIRLLSDGNSNIPRGIYSYTFVDGLYVANFSELDPVLGETRVEFDFEAFTKDPADPMSRDAGCKFDFLSGDKSYCGYAVAYWDKHLADPTLEYARRGLFDAYQWTMNFPPEEFMEFEINHVLQPQVFGLDCEPSETLFFRMMLPAKTIKGYLPVSPASRDLYWAVRAPFSTMHKPSFVSASEIATWTSTRDWDKVPVDPEVFTEEDKDAILIGPEHADDYIVLTFEYLPEYDADIWKFGDCFLNNGFIGNRFIEALPLFSETQFTGFKPITMWDGTPVKIQSVSYAEDYSYDVLIETPELDTSGTYAVQLDRPFYDDRYDFDKRYSGRWRNGQRFTATVVDETHLLVNYQDWTPDEHVTYYDNYVVRTDIAIKATNLGTYEQLEIAGPYRGYPVSNATFAYGEKVHLCVPPGTGTTAYVQIGNEYSQYQFSTDLVLTGNIIFAPWDFGGSSTGGTVNVAMSISNLTTVERTFPSTIEYGQMLDWSVTFNTATSVSPSLVVKNSAGTRVASSSGDGITLPKLVVTTFTNHETLGGTVLVSGWQWVEGEEYTLTISYKGRKK